MTHLELMKKAMENQVMVMNWAMWNSKELFDSAMYDRMQDSVVLLVEALANADKPGST